MEIQNSTFYLSRGALIALCKAASDDRSRPNLNQIRFCPQEGTAVATDGHAMLVATAPSPGNGGPVTFSRDALWALTKITGAKSFLLDTGMGLGVARDKRGQEIVSITLQPTGLTFPSYHQVIPAPRSGEAPAIRAMGAGLLSRCMAAMCKALGGRSDLVEVDCGDPMDPVCFTGRDEDNAQWVYVVMPMRGGGFARERVSHSADDAAVV